MANARPATIISVRVAGFFDRAMVDRFAWRGDEQNARPIQVTSGSGASGRERWWHIVTIFNYRHLGFRAACLRIDVTVVVPSARCVHLKPVAWVEAARGIVLSRLAD